MNDSITIRDPIHGGMLFSRAEKAVIDSPAVQRLRGIRQLGFAELAFPGASHSRYAHSLGAMYLAGMIADRWNIDLPRAERDWLRQRVRLAALLHDVGHAPLSHSSEKLMPALADLGLPEWVREPNKVQATHEDFSLLLLLSSPLADTLKEQFGPDCSTEIAALICGRLPPSGSPFIRSSVDYFPLLRQLVSGELDVDRMDYLLRDSFYTGVRYGQYDQEWLCQHARAHITTDASVEGIERAYLAVGNRAIFAFEDFLLSRYHMFLAVYYHHIPVGFDFLMNRYADSRGGEYTLPVEPEAYLRTDDAELWVALRRSPNPWARQIASRRGFALLLETTERDRAVDKAALTAALERAGISFFSTTSASTLSKYIHEPAFPLYVVTDSLNQATKIADYTPLFERYAASVKVSRIYVEPARYPDAKIIVKRELGIVGS